MNSDDSSFTREQLEQAIAAQESLRGTLDDAIVDTTIASLRKQLAELDPVPVIEQQRKLVTVLFMDVVGSTMLMGELDPEESMAIMDTALQQLAVPVETHGGRVTRFMGDGYLAVFGLPRANENDPEMAVRAGLGILETAKVIAQELENEWHIKGFQVRVGVNTGLVVAGGVTEAEGTVMGAGVNLAARLESSAPPGGLLISQHTYQHVLGIFEVEPGKAILIKGFTKPVQVYLVKKPKPHAFRMMTRGVEGVETHMVGREQELKSLQRSLEIIIQNHTGCFVTVVGEAGLGKSRLLHEFELWLSDQPLTSIQFKGRATLDTLELPYGLLRDLMASRFGILDDDPILMVRNKVVDGFKEALGEVENLDMQAHFVGHLLGYDFSDSPYVQGVLDAPRQLHERAFVYLSDYIKALALDNPVIFFLDDIHWADESSVDILLRLGDALSDQRVLLIALSRPSLFERRPSWGAEPYHQRIDLQPLSRVDSQQLVREVLQKVQDVPEVLSDLIIGNAEGNPYYLEELIKMLVEDGVIVKDEPKWRVQVDRLAEVRIPPTLTGVVQARLDGLPTEERTVMQQASVVGRVFWDAAVSYINKNTTSDQVSSNTGPLDIVQYLSNLLHKEMIFQREASAFSDTAEYFFKHTILREVTYESVLKRRRRVYHAMVADWLIVHSGERAGEVTGLIAGHLERAGKIEAALDYMSQAAAAAASNYAIDEAAGFYARALALTLEDDVERRYKLLLGSEMVFGMQGNRDAQREILDSLTVVADVLADERKRVEVLIRRAWLAYFLGEYQVMIAAAQQAVELTAAVEEQDLARQAYYAWAWGYLQQGDSDRALVYANDALSLVRQVGDRRDEGNILNILGMINIAQGDYSTASGYLQEFLFIAREIGDQEREITALNNLGVAHTSLGNYPVAQDNFEQILNIVCELGDRVSESTSLINLAWVMSAQGEWESTLKYAERGIVMKREFEQIEATAEGLIWLGHAWLGLEQPKEAIAAYQEAMEIRQELNLPHLAMEAIAGLAQAALIQSELQTAVDQIEQIVAYLSEGGTLRATWEPLRIYLACYRVFKLVEDQRAGEILEAAHNLLQERAVRIRDEQDRQRYLENVPWHREIVTEWETSQV